MYSHRSSGDGRRARWRWIVALLFLLGQIHANLHAAEYGADSHEHDGTPCAIQFLAEAVKELSAPTFATVRAPRLAGIVQYDRVRGYLVRRTVADQHYIRGPPILLA